MVRLKNCKAWYDKNNLQSYNTMIIQRFIDDNGVEIIRYNNYRNNRTLEHIRKYIQQLWDNLCFDMSRKVLLLYNYARQHKDKAIIIMINGEIYERG